jgi:glycine oxidase
MPSPEVVVVGGGLIGLSIAWRLAQAGTTVTVCDPVPGTRTSSVAAGMLAPVTEVEYGEDALLQLNLASARAWPSFAAELEDASGLPAGLYETGTLSVAYDVDDAAALRRLADYQRRLGLEVHELTGREARKREPMLAWPPPRRRAPGWSAPRSPGSACPARPRPGSSWSAASGSTPAPW